MTRHQSPFCTIVTTPNRGRYVSCRFRPWQTRRSHHGKSTNQTENAISQDMTCCCLMFSGFSVEMPHHVFWF